MPAPPTGAPYVGAADLVPETRDRILEGALQVLGRVGMRRLTMGEVSQFSGVSRGTVYRYFPTKDDLLAVMAEYEQERFAHGLRMALAAGAAAEEPLTLETITGYVLGYLRDHPALTLLVESEPAFVLGFLRRQLSVFRRICEELVSPVMEDAEPVRDGRLTVAELNDLLLRIVLCVFLVPADRVEGDLEGALDSFLRLAGPVDGPPRPRPGGGAGPRGGARRPGPDRTGGS